MVYLAAGEEVHSMGASRRAVLLQCSYRLAPRGMKTQREAAAASEEVEETRLLLVPQSLQLPVDPPFVWRVSFLSRALSFEGSLPVRLCRVVATSGDCMIRTVTIF